MSDAATRILELAEQTLIAADNEDLSVAGHIARVYAAVEADDFETAWSVLLEVDKLINGSRNSGSG